MKAEPRFLKQPKSFWAHVRTLSQQLGYTQRGTGQIKVHSLAQIQAGMEKLDLATAHLIDHRTRPTTLARNLLDYFGYRAETLNSFVAPRLMNKDSARLTFEEQRAKLCPNCPIPLNKQKGEKKAPAYFTALINMLIEANADGMECDYDPRVLTTITKKNQPVRTLARRVDGAFPGPVNPIAIWEVKEYYYTTTFGSRVADGVYETLLDGMELEELGLAEGVEVKHYLMVDDHFTWWECGRSYLCRIIDMLHMRYVDEVLFGREVLDRLPNIVRDWVKIARARTRV